LGNAFQRLLPNQENVQPLTRNWFLKNGFSVRTEKIAESWIAVRP